jgi:putative endopeptidase
VTEYYRRIRTASARCQGKPVDKDCWDTSVFAVNAYYRPSANEIVLPAGLLQPPFYVRGGPKEVNFGGIGCIIAHELTHAIDFHGAQFDEKGDANCWWSDGDKERFAALSAKAAAHYDGYEAAPGIPISGARTLFENIADLGMAACMLDCMETLPSADYDLFFRSAARVWASTSTRKALDIKARSGIHCPDNARVNKTFQNFQDFYDVYKVEFGDGMYVSPDMRLSIW